tara:strand:+ start:244 stop:465 length:222 start_codon:yes stop_codon:yes gene_type:complete
MISKLIIEQAANKCRIPKKMKLFWSTRKVTKVIMLDIITKVLKRVKNLLIKLLEFFDRPEDMPEITKKLAPIH